MADVIKVDTAKVTAAADRMANYNRKMRDEFSSVESAMKSLDAVWESSAASSVMSAFNTIKNTYKEARYDVVDRYVTFLKQQVDPSYTKTENTNKSLSDMFK